MRAAVVNSFGGPEVVEIVDTEVPEPSAGEVRIKVAAAALNPCDVAARSGAYGGAGQRIGLGWDVAGTIDAVGEGSDWNVGDKVVALFFGLIKRLGTHAEYVVVPADSVAGAPKTLDSTHAATLPLNTLTALQALELLELTEGQSLLVTGAAGAVGAYAVQLAVRRGIVVTGLAREGDAEFVRSLGAAHATSGEPKSFDAVLDAAVLGERALAWVRDGGAYVGLLPPLLPAAERGVRTSAIEVNADGASLAELVRLADEGALTPRVAGTYALEEAAKAHARFAEGGVRGRLVLLP
ncbi:NADP-dependent oxidoreductase [Streptomyces sp. A012304]|uniref:NADP-dependent oxidoreductase n=1 Tax=Streptomyces sp. A012304 TaxID=375446 RepID=UPI00223041BB|nr:NADP-dependent oxidoreductase [Streptomyces sp. A012304]GKQ39156.1 NADPH:quinone reductase [Streptomyces sp. A012304]